LINRHTDTDAADILSGHGWHPEETWYWLALGSIGSSALLKLMDKDHWSLFVGQWPPTFLLFGLYHRLLRPGSQ
jgi:hypothetical protein